MTSEITSIFDLTNKLEREKSCSLGVRNCRKNRFAELLLERRNKKFK